jgi:hypothetical protein
MYIDNKFLLPDVVITPNKLIIKIFYKIEDNINHSDLITFSEEHIPNTGTIIVCNRDNQIIKIFDEVIKVKFAENYVQLINRGIMKLNFWTCFFRKDDINCLDVPVTERNKGDFSVDYKEDCIVIKSIDETLVVKSY